MNRFFRRKGAYLVGRLVAEAGYRPLVLALLHGERGLVVDAVLTDVDHVSVLFSFTRSHFHVDLDRLRAAYRALSPRAAPGSRAGSPPRRGATAPSGSSTARRNGSATRRSRTTS